VSVVQSIALGVGVMAALFILRPRTDLQTEWRGYIYTGVYLLAGLCASIAAVLSP